MKIKKLLKNEVNFQKLPEGTSETANLPKKEAKFAKKLNDVLKISKIFLKIDQNLQNNLKI